MNRSTATAQTAINIAIFVPVSSRLFVFTRKRTIADTKTITNGITHVISGAMFIGFLPFFNRSFFCQSLENGEDDSDRYEIQGSEIPACSNLKRDGEEHVDNSTRIVESYRSAPQPVEKFNHDDLSLQFVRLSAIAKRPEAI